MAELFKFELIGLEQLLKNMEELPTIAMKKTVVRNALKKSLAPVLDAAKQSAPKGKTASIFQNVRFDLDNYTVKGQENLEKLEKIAHFLVNHPKTHVFVEGHADERGASAYNLALGSRRANSVRTFLLENGVHPDQLFTISYGKERPEALGHDEFAWQQNRRSQFKLYAR